MKKLMSQIENGLSPKRATTLRFILFIFISLICKSYSQVINSTTYPVTTTSGQSLNSFTSLGTLLSTGKDDDNSVLTNIGFDFWFNGVRYRQFGVNANGHLRLGAVIGSAHYTNNLADSAEDPKIAPYWDDLTTGSDGYVKYGLLGTAPNRSLVIEWKTNYFVNNTSVTLTAPMLFQVVLSENTGKIQFIYGGTIATGTGYSTGFNNSGTAMVSLATATNTATYGTDSNVNQTTSITSGKSYTFTPTNPVSPSSLTFSNIAGSSMTLNWIDNAMNEVGFVVYTSTDNSTFTFNQQVASNTISANVTGLTSNTLYYFRVYAVSEGALSSPVLSGSKSTIDQVVFTSGNAFWTVPTCVTSVTVEVWGAGGGGGSSNNTNTNGGSGGGGGAYAKGTHTVVPGSSYFYNVGNSGAGGPANSTTAPTAGGQTWFNAIASINTVPVTNASGTLAIGGGPGVNNSIVNPTNAGAVASCFGNVTTASGIAGNGGTSSGGRNGGAGASPGGGAGGAGSTSANGSNGTTPGGGGGGNDRRVNYGGQGAVGQIIISYSTVITTITSTPIVTAGICAGATSVSGTSSEANGTTINLYKGGISLGTTIVSSGIWNVTSLTALVAGDIITATAIAPSCKAVSSSSTSVTVTAANTAVTASSILTLCINTALTAITRTTTGATGIGTATGLPTGVTAAWASNVITVSGTPSASGTFNYSIPLTGGCGTVNATGTITVTAAPTIATNTSTQTMCSSTTAIVISGNSPLVGIGVWSIVSGPSTLSTQFSSNSSLAIFTPVGGVGAYVIRWSISNGSCTTSTADATVTVVSETIVGIVTGGSTICSGSTSGLLTLSGHTGTVIRWESSISPFSTWTPIANTATTYTSGNLNQETRFRAVVQNNSCSILNSAFTAVTMGNTSIWNGSSWSNGVPTSSTVAIIAGNYVSATNGGNINACTLTINSSNVVISSGNTVSLFGALNVISGSFTIENNANLLQSTNVSNSGNIIVKRNSPSLMRQDYILWSSPIANQQLLAFSPATLVNRFYTYDAATDKYAPVASPSTTNFAPGIGYLIRVSNMHPTTPTIFGGQFTGVANNGTVNLPVTNATYNAVGNPYPSTINANTFIAQNGITEALYFWRKTNNSNNSSYATYTTAGGVCNSGGDPLSLTTNGIIAIGQGFIVKVTSTNVTFNNTMRVSNTNAPFLRTFDERNRIWLNLSSVSGAFYQTMVSYMPNATSNVDAAIDGRFLNDTQNALTSLIDGQEYTIQGRALPFDGSDTILLGFKAKIAENYTITLSNFDGLFSSNQSVYIKDNLTNTVQDLKSGPYIFASEAGIFNTRFEIVYQNNSLSNQTSSFNQNSVVVYKQGQEVVINSGKVQMANVEIYDIRGRLLVSKYKINVSEVKLSTGTTKQVLIVKITSVANGTVTKKVIN